MQDGFNKTQWLLLTPRFIVHSQPTQTETGFRLISVVVFLWSVWYYFCEVLF